MSNPFSNPAFYKSLWALMKMAGKELGNVWQVYRSHNGRTD